MKSDELQQVENPIEWGLYYDKSEVDAAIAELKAENERLNNALDKERSETIKYMDELCNAKNEIERLTIDKRNAELRADVADATIAELKAKLESVQASTYVDSVDAGMRERRLRRELWSARTLALSRFDVDEYLRKYKHHDSRYWNDGLNTFNEACKLMQKAINKAEAICQAKAKEYK